MARYVEPTEAELVEFAEWLADRPPIVQELAARFDPWSLFLLKTTGHRVAIVAYGEDGTVRVEVSACVNPGLLFDRTVFGIDPDDLEPCDIPEDAGPHEPILSTEEVIENIDALRVMMRPVPCHGPAVHDIQRPLSVTGYTHQPCRRPYSLASCSVRNPAR